MSRIPPSPIGTTDYERVMGHAPHVLEPWTRLEEVFFERSLLPDDLLEQVRRTLAQGHGCAYCMAKAGPPAATHTDARTALAVDLARAFAADHKAIDEARIAALRAHFTDPELVELVAFMSFMWAGGTFGRVLGIAPPLAPVGPPR